MRSPFLHVFTLAAGSLWFGQPTIASAQGRHFEARAKGEVIAAEESQLLGDTVVSTTSLPSTGATLRARAVLRPTGSASLEVLYEATGRAQSIIVSVADSTISFRVEEAGKKQSKDLPFSPQRPLLIYQNFIFSSFAEAVRRLNVQSESQLSIQVFVVDTGQIYDWTVGTDPDSTVHVVANNGMRFDLSFNGQELREIKIPAQGLVISAAPH